MITLRHNLRNLLVALDQVLNVLLGIIFSYKAWSDETLSSQAYRWYLTDKHIWIKKTIDWIFFWEDNHCKISYEYERNRLHLPPELRS